ncbi:MAG: hypothetical protein IIA45_11270 [Bacteroidetes bacterium]|nr:hypothetical protein [Bacteroidota bacterium]
MEIKPILKGLATYIPGMYRPTDKGTKGSSSARYCYSVWLRHLTYAFKNSKDRIKFQEEISPILNEEIEINLHLLKIDEFQDVSIDSEKVPQDYIDFYIEWFVTD